MSHMDVRVPDIGDFKDVPVIEVHVAPGDRVRADDPLITLESDKAAMEIPAPQAGEIAELLVKVGDKVGRGSIIMRLTGTGAGTGAGAVAPAPSAAPPSEPNQATAPAQANPDAPPERHLPPVPSEGAVPSTVDYSNVLAGPSVRRLARELDVDITKLKGTGDKGRVTKDDVKAALAGLAAPSGGHTGIPEIPAQDFAKYGPIEVRAMSRLRRLSGPHLHRAWLNVPHVTHTDEADITALEAYRKELDAQAKEKGYRVTLLAFLLKTSVPVLKEFPEFNASLAPERDALIYKRYFNIGVAVDTPDGLVVPVIKDVDRKGILELSQDLAAASARMREGKISPADISGGTFSISSLGGIGGTAFTPIVNAPEVAILGVPRAAIKPVWDGSAFQPRLVLPLCVSYDHRVIDGALAARFTRRLAEILGDVRQLAL
ncbi:MAG: 2-oxo acid dehydrogenase subunit E2 [Hyphomicrobium sp.]|jgi:pyruvate dehydrogenase E2 component (dihydrolipoamide acetyltransferase)|uniref:2-oxo acid dehydrogenase subunit E2 n=1 Tax=Hyphomicrobium sp. TaxID=82 RepID=UPI0025B8F0CE|nr:2-oxo acid dehydrogenase subunit E2 [Hyphomicrobium sp.]MBX9863670.1 2-oxo acid dehydrogenase subunit E2 [Hyphomicrobium sp.]